MKSRFLLSETKSLIPYINDKLFSAISFHYHIYIYLSRLSWHSAQSQTTTPSDKLISSLYDTMVYSPPMYRSLSDQYIRNGERERELIQNLLEVLLSSDLLPREDSLRLGGVQSVEGLAAGLGGIQGGLSGLLSGYERFSVSGSSSSERIRQ
jgi:hypothetical protein